MKNGKYFKWNELVRSNTAERYNIKNNPTGEEEKNLEFVLDWLDELREGFGKPIYISSGYRCAELNRRVGGVSNSQHTKGEAVDINLGSKKANSEILLYILNNCYFDQLLDENNLSWVHVSVKKEGNRQTFRRLKK